MLNLFKSKNIIDVFLVIIHVVQKRKEEREGSEQRAF